MFEYLRKPHSNLASLLLRIGLGAIFLAHGYIKVYQEGSWTDQISPTMQHIVGWTEVISGSLLFLGLFSRLACLALIGVMIGAICIFTGPRDFIAIGMGMHGFNFKASGYEYNVVIIIACLALITLGSGFYSLDHLIFCRKKGQPSRQVSFGEPEAAPAQAPAPLGQTTP